MTSHGTQTSSRAPAIPERAAPILFAIEKPKSLVSIKTHKRYQILRPIQKISGFIIINVPFPTSTSGKGGSATSKHKNLPNHFRPRRFIPKPRCAVLTKTVGQPYLFRRNNTIPFKRWPANPSLCSWLHLHYNEPQSTYLVYLEAFPHDFLDTHRTSRHFENLEEH